MKMTKGKKKSAGSDTAARLGGGTGTSGATSGGRVFPALPRSADYRESSDGVPGGLGASPPGNDAIAAVKEKEKAEDMMEVETGSTGEDREMEEGESERGMAVATTPEEEDEESVWAGYSEEEEERDGFFYDSEQREKIKSNRRKYREYLEDTPTECITWEVRNYKRWFGLIPQDLSLNERKTVDRLVEAYKVVAERGEKFCEEISSLKKQLNIAIRRIRQWQDAAPKTKEVTTRTWGTQTIAPVLKEDVRGGSLREDRGSGPELGSKVDALDRKVEALTKELRSFIRDGRVAPSEGVGGVAPMKKKKRKKRSEVAAAPLPSSSAPPGRGSGGGVAVGGEASALSDEIKGRKKRTEAAMPAPPKTAAVLITVPEGGGVSYAEVLRRAREKIPIAQMGINDIRCRRAINGGVILEIPGDRAGEGADRLARGLLSELADTGVRVSRPVRRVGLRLTGLDDSVSPGEVGHALAEMGECRRESVLVGEISRSPSGMGVAIVQCPVGAAQRAVREGVRVGWGRARAQLLSPRPLRCHKCLEVGHVRALCASLVDRSQRCYRCGNEGHQAGRCSATAPRYPLCADLGRPSGHRLGGEGCPRATGRDTGARGLGPGGSRGVPVTAAASSSSVIKDRTSGGVEMVWEPVPSASHSPG